MNNTNTNAMKAPSFTGSPVVARACLAAYRAGIDTLDTIQGTDPPTSPS